MTDEPTGENTQRAVEIVDGEVRAVQSYDERSGFPEPPLHALSSLVTAALDGLWSVPEIVALVSIGGLPAIPVIMAGSGLTCLTAVTLVQRFVSRDGWGASFAKGFAMGVIAAVPFPFTGTAAGSLLLLWSGAYQLLKRRQLPPG
jgi:hypothetical protein